MPANRAKMAMGRIREAMRLAKRVPGTQKPIVIPYYRYLFTDTRNYLSKDDTLNIVHAIRTSGAHGMILWGSSNDLNSM